MGFFTSLKAIFSAPKGLDMVDKGLDSLYAGVDKVFFTAEEKSEAALKITEAAIEMVKSTQGESTVRSVTRRIMAILIMGPFVLLICSSAVVWRFDPAWAKVILEAAGMLSNLALAVGIFYFGYYGIKQIVKK